MKNRLDILGRISCVAMILSVLGFSGTWLYAELCHVQVLPASGADYGVMMGMVMIFGVTIVISFLGFAMATLLARPKAPEFPEYMKKH